MKKSNTCPKCGSKEIEKNLAVQGGVPFTMLYRGMLKDWVKVEAFVCKNCGYCELWVQDRHMRYLQEDKTESL